MPPLLQPQGSCQSELHRALERLAASQSRTHEDLYIIPIPNCDRNGNFHPKQVGLHLLPAGPWPQLWGYRWPLHSVVQHGGPRSGEAPQPTPNPEGPPPALELGLILSTSLVSEMRKLRPQTTE